MLLALDTSTLTLSLALCERRGGKVVVVEEAFFGPPRKQSDLLPQEIKSLLDRHQVKLTSLEGIAVGLGPGSFTGLRIGLATAKALGYAAKVSVAGVSSLKAVAPEGPEGRRLFVCAVARVGEFYVGTYRNAAGRVVQEGEEQALSPVEFAECLRRDPDAVALGPGMANARADLLALGVGAERLLARGEFPRAVRIAELAVLPDAFDREALFALEPHYVRASEAEQNPKFPPPPGPPPTPRLRHD